MTEAIDAVESCLSRARSAARDAVASGAKTAARVLAVARIRAELRAALATLDAQDLTPPLELPMDPPRISWLRRKSGDPAHAFYVFDGGGQGVSAICNQIARSPDVSWIFAPADSARCKHCEERLFLR